MKTKLGIAFVLAANLLVLFCLAHRYEFRSGLDGRVMWRCNSFTGKTEYASIGRDKWISISSVEQTTPVEVKRMTSDGYEVISTPDQTTSQNKSDQHGPWEKYAPITNH